MNTPTHIACGACLATSLANACQRYPRTSVRVGLLAAGALLLGLLSHLLLDLLPHYAWVVHFEGFRSLPFHWLIREAVFGIAVAIPAFILSGKAWPYVALGMLGGIYPDVEKVLSVDFHIPDRFILFAWHSTCLSSRTAGLPRSVLIGIECLLIAGFLLAMWSMKMAVSREASTRAQTGVASGSSYSARR